MPDDLTVDAAKFDRILARMLDSKPLSKAEISARIKAEMEVKRENVAKYKAEMREKTRKYLNSKKLGQQP
jgi:hypothetical protein